MKLETWVAIACIGLSAMFVTLILSLFNFLIGPDGTGPTRVVDPTGLLVQEIAISAAPSLVLAGFVFVQGRGAGSKASGIILLGAGGIMVVGMLVANSLVMRIASQYVVGGIGSTPYLFIIAGGAVAAMGGYLALVSKKVRNAGELDDLR